jgi:hypothetical protein
MWAPVVQWSTVLIVMILAVNYNYFWFSAILQLLSSMGALQKQPTSTNQGVSTEEMGMRFYNSNEHSMV